MSKRKFIASIHFPVTVESPSSDARHPEGHTAVFDSDGDCLFTFDPSESDLHEELLEHFMQDVVDPAAEFDLERVTS